MTALDDIFALACAYVSVPTGEEETMRTLCAAARQRLRSQMAEGVKVEEIYESFLCACALLAAADFSCVRAGADVKSFSAGPVSVTCDDGQHAQRLREQAALIMAPWCQEAFRFLGVKA